MRAVKKASHVGSIAAQNGWKGKLDSEVVDGQRITSLTGRRNDESFYAYWEDEKLSRAGYFIFSRETRLTCAKQLIEKIEGWPDLIKLYKWFPDANRPNLTQTYRKLPFDLDDDDEEIISKLLGRKLFWYGHESTKIHTDVVLKSKSKKIRIQNVGHRKLFHFIGAQAGFRSVLLDTLIKVG